MRARSSGTRTDSAGNERRLFLDWPARLFSEGAAREAAHAVALAASIRLARAGLPMGAGRRGGAGVNQRIRDGQQAYRAALAETRRAAQTGDRTALQAEIERLSDRLAHSLPELLAAAVTAAVERFERTCICRCSPQTCAAVASCLSRRPCCCSGASTTGGTLPRCPPSPVGGRSYVGPPPGSPPRGRSCQACRQPIRSPSRGRLPR